MQTVSHRTAAAASTLALAVAVLAAPSSTEPASAEATATTCRGSYVVTLTPGLSNTPARGTAYTKQPGTITCNGPVLGKTPTGKGSVVNLARIGVEDPDSCLAGGEGRGALIVEMPVAGGKTLTLHDGGNFEYGGLKRGLLTGTFDFDRMRGTFTVNPLKGNCVTTPVTQARIDFTGKLKR